MYLFKADEVMFIYFYLLVMVISGGFNYGIIIFKTI